MRAVGWPHAPDLSPDETARLTVVAGVRPRQVTASDLNGNELGRLRLAEREADIAMLTLPQNNEWGTMLALVKAPSLAAGPVPVAQRAGATLWFATTEQPLQSTAGHAVEWVDPGEWYLVASHLSTDFHWWDVVGWGTGWGSTIEAELRQGHADTGLSFIGVGEPIVMAKLCFHNRTFSHDEIVTQADVKMFPGDPTITWDVSSGAADEALSITGQPEPTHSWDAASARSKRRALKIVPVRVPVWGGELKVRSSCTTVRINRGGDGFVVSGTTPRHVPGGRTLSLMDTPYPVDDDTTR